MSKPSKKSPQGGTKLLITVDCGITAIESAERAMQLGLDLVITDHHQPKSSVAAGRGNRPSRHWMGLCQSAFIRRDGGI